MQCLDGKDQRADDHGGTVGKDQKPARKSGHRDDNDQGEEGSGCEDVIVEAHLVIRASYDEKSDSGDTDDQTGENQCANKEPPFANA